MPKNSGLFRKRLQGMILAGATLLGGFACNASPSPTQPPDPAPPPVQAPVNLVTPAPKASVTAPPALGEIRGREYLDLDNNRQFGTTDKPVTGWSVYLYPSSALQSNTWNAPYATTTTDTSGNFSFTGLPSGTYLVASAARSSAGKSLQQLTPLETSPATCVTLPQQAQAYCQPVAYQVTLPTAQACDLAFCNYGSLADIGGYPGYPGYPGYFGYPGEIPVIGEIYPVPVPIPFEPPINLRSAAGYAILAGTAVNNTGNSIVNGAIGVSPGSTVTGFPPGLVNGSIEVANENAFHAKNDLATAISDGFGRASDSLRGGQLAGLVLSPGVYRADQLTLEANRTLTLDAEGAGSSAVWIFQAQSNLAADTLSRVALTGGARAENVYWVVGGSANIGPGSIFVGSILAQQSITLGSGVNLMGRALALTGSVELDTAVVDNPSE